MSTDDELRAKQRTWLTEEIGRTNIRERQIAKYPISAYIGAKVRPGGWIAILVLLASLAVRTDEVIGRLIVLLIFAITAADVVGAWWRHHFLPRRNPQKREVVDRWRRNKVEAQEAADRMVHPDGSKR